MQPPGKPRRSHRDVGPKPPCAAAAPPRDGAGPRRPPRRAPGSASGGRGWLEPCRVPAVGGYCFLCRGWRFGFRDSFSFKRNAVRSEVGLTLTNQIKATITRQSLFLCTSFFLSPPPKKKCFQRNCSRCQVPPSVLPGRPAAGCRRPAGRSRAAAARAPSTVAPAPRPLAPRLPPRPACSASRTCPGWASSQVPPTFVCLFFFRLCFPPFLPPSPPPRRGAVPSAHVFFPREDSPGCQVIGEVAYTDGVFFFNKSGLCQVLNESAGQFAKTRLPMESK